MTYTNKVIFKYNNSTLKLISTLANPAPIKEGWGMTHDSKGLLYISNGSNTIFVINPTNFTIIR